MSGFANDAGARIVLAMVGAIQQNKAYLSDVDGQIGDGDHGVNMNKGFTMCAERLEGGDAGFTQALETLGEVLLGEIGGSMGPIYGTLFLGMAEAADGAEQIDASVFGAMLGQGVEELMDIVDARQGDKTLMDALLPARHAYDASVGAGASFGDALQAMCEAAERGKEATKDMVAKFGRSSRLGERSRGVLDAGAVSCALLLRAMADEIRQMI